MANVILLYILNLFSKMIEYERKIPKSQESPSVQSSNVDNSVSGDSLRLTAEEMEKFMDTTVVEEVNEEQYKLGIFHKSGIDTIIWSSFTTHESRLLPI